MTSIGGRRPDPDGRARHRGTAVPRVGFVGLGDQGEPIAYRIADSGRFSLAVYARRPSQADRVVARGARRAESIRELARDSDILAICVSNDAAVLDVVDLAFPGLAPGSVLLIHSTIHPDTCSTVAALAEQVGTSVLDAPVSGGAQRAREGKLTVMVGGEKGTFETIRPLLSTFGTAIVYAGGLGAGQQLKLVNNYLFAAHRELAWQAASVLTRLNMDMAESMTAIAASTGGSEAIRRVAEAGGVEGLARHRGGPAASIEFLQKDIGLFRAMAQEPGGFSPEVDQIAEAGARRAPQQG